jgi:UDP-2,4-diacetamido-2,4,6-trideoxy-beta-L-altropyranose hydrolase
VAFLSRAEGAALAERVVGEGMQFVPLEASNPDPRDLGFTLHWLEGLVSAGEDREAIWVVCDGYDFNPSYHQALRSDGWRVLVIDDMAHLARYHATVVLNQNVGAEELRYAGDPDTTWLLGPRYTQLRAEFLRWRGWSRDTRANARRVLVTMGGGDPDNATLTVLKGLAASGGQDWEVAVVVGPTSRHRSELERVASGFPGWRVLVAVTDMADLMAWADMAVSAGGSTCWEMAFMGLPTVTVVLAPNQQRIAEGLAAAGASINLGVPAQVSPSHLADAVRHLGSDAPRRQAMSSAGRSLIDGDGAARVVSTLASAPTIPPTHAHSLSR